MTQSRVGMLVWLLLPFVISCHPICESNQPALSLAQLFQRCQLPADCTQTLNCNHSTITVWGYIDTVNIFDHQNYPRFHYEKFILRDGDGRKLGVWVQADKSESKAIFAKIRSWSVNDRKAIVVQGKIESVKHFTMEGCRQGVRLIVANQKQVNIYLSKRSVGKP